MQVVSKEDSAYKVLPAQYKILPAQYLDARQGINVYTLICITAVAHGQPL